MVAVAEAEGAPYSDSTIATEPEAVRKLVQRGGREGVQLEAAYEAGPTGYALQRELAEPESGSFAA